MTETLHAAREEEATRWFAALRRGVMSVEEREAFEEWRRDRQNRVIFAEIERDWQELALLHDCFGSAIKDGRAKKATQPFRRSALVAAMCAVSLAIGVLSYTGNDSFWTTLDWTAR
jgi:transmembrane sensor